MPKFSDGGVDKRRERRVEASLPVMFVGLDGVKGAVTRDVSASGMYFESGTGLAPGALFDLNVDIDTSSGKRILSGRGVIVRVDSINDRFGCAVKILESRLLKP